MTDPRVLGLLRSLPTGDTVWLPSAGNSMWPLIRGGDVVLVRRCGPEELLKGDIAILELGSALIAHIVIRVDPLATASIVGVPDAAGVTALGRVIALRRGSTRVDLPRPLRRLVRLLPGAARALKRVPLFRRLVRRVRGE